MVSDIRSSQTVLVVEDDQFAGTGLRTILEANGYRVVLVANARQALERLRAGLAADAVLLDMILPDCDGWQFFGARRREAIYAVAPVIVMTGLGIASPEWAAALGAVDFLRKPFSVEDVLEKLRRHAGGAPSLAPQKS
jgi:CheY-like chemotaxis protein